jgi:hypothetical protein
MTFESTSSDDALKYGMGILKRVYKIGKKKDDTQLMLAVADRLMLLYESMTETEKGKRQLPAGFGSLHFGDGNEDDRG